MDAYENLREQFRTYLKAFFTSDKTIKSCEYMAFYAAEHGDEIGVKFDDIISSGISLEDYQKHLEEYFINIKRKYPQENAAVHKKAVQRLLDFVKGDPIIPGQTTVKKAKKTKRALAEIASPTRQAVLDYLDKWEQAPNHKVQEEALDLLFGKLFPLNTNLNEVLLKCSSLDGLYSTNIFKAYPLALHIVKLDIDARLASGDAQLVNDISRGHGIRTKSGKENRVLSFASKYCSRYNPEAFPTYDHYVEELLLLFQAKDGFSDFDYRKEEEALRDYPTFKKAVADFRKKYGLEEFSFAQLDRYLWLLGKDSYTKKPRAKK